MCVCVRMYGGNHYAHQVNRGRHQKISMSNHLIAQRVEQQKAIVQQQHRRDGDQQTEHVSNVLAVWFDNLHDICASPAKLPRYVCIS